MKHEIILHHNAPVVSDNHVATFSVSFYFDENALTIKYCKLFAAKQGHKFVSWPAYKNKDGKWVKLVFCTRDLQSKVIESVLDEMGKKEDHSVLKDEPNTPWEDLEEADKRLNNV